MSADSGERTEQASERQMKENRKKGKLSRSADVSAWAIVAACTVMLPTTLMGAQDAATYALFQINRVAGSADPMIVLQVLGEAGGNLAAAVMPLLAVAFLTAVVVPFFQGPVTFRSMAPKFDHFNPVSAAKKILGPQAWWNAAKALLKASAVGALMYVVIQAVVGQLMGAGLTPVWFVADTVSAAAIQLLWFSIVAGLIMAAADVMVVAKRNRKQTRVTKQEAKQEHKSSEGDPMVKGQRRQRQMAMSRNRMIADVSSAEAVIVNPVHVAVAIRYREDDGAPVIIASGKGAVAEKIREKAIEAGVPLLKQVDLAWLMHDHCHIGRPVPPELYGAIATVIAFTRKLDARARNRRIHDLGPVELPEGWQS